MRRWISQLLFRIINRIEDGWDRVGRVGVPQPTPDAYIAMRNQIQAAESQQTARQVQQDQLAWERQAQLQQLYALTNELQAPLYQQPRWIIPQRLTPNQGHEVLRLTEAGTIQTQPTQVWGAGRGRWSLDRSGRRVSVGTLRFDSDGGGGAGDGCSVAITDIPDELKVPEGL